MLDVHRHGVAMIHAPQAAQSKAEDTQLADPDLR
jgi:hypothetical protein